MADYTVTLSDEEEKALDYYIANIWMSVSGSKVPPDKKTLVEVFVHNSISPYIKSMIASETASLDEVWTKLSVEDKATIEAIVAKTKGG